MLLLVACQSTPVARAEVESLLRIQVEAWNRGDLGGFLDGYWRDDELTMLGASGPIRGYPDLERRYRKGWSQPSSMVKLSFEIL